MTYKDLKPNPDNPRTIGKDEFERLKKKIAKNPDGLTAQRIVHKDGIIIAGNQRWRAINELQLELKDEWFKDVTGWTEEQIQDWLIDSNISDGEWDYDMLANQYEPEYLLEHGIELPYYEEPPIDLKTDDPEYTQMTFTLHNSQKQIVDDAIAKAKSYITGDEPNENSNGNGLFYVARHFVEY